MVKMLEKLKKTYQNFLFGNQHTVNHLIKTMLADPTNPSEKIFLKARYNYFLKNNYNKNISQGERIMLSNILVHNYENTIRELPHFIYHTLENNGRLQILPDEEILNLAVQKYGDFLIIKNKESIEAKTFYRLSNKSIEDIIRQYRKNSRNNKFKFSIFYKELLNISVEESVYKLKSELNISNNQIFLKPLDSVLKNCTDENIEKVINYYNISWFDYQSENNNNIVDCLNEILNGTVVNIKTRNQIIEYKQSLLGKNMKLKKRKFSYPYKNIT